MPEDDNHISREAFDALVGRVSALEESMTENTETTKRVEVNTEGLVEMFNALSGGFKVLVWIGKAARPIGYIAACAAGVVGLWTALKGGGHIK
ncbi:MAG: hypothetical protein ACN6OP_29355 [Pseudomonadales bacterium]